jgi:hypothetical protein
MAERTSSLYIYVGSDGRRQHLTEEIKMAKAATSKMRKKIRDEVLEGSRPVRK